MNKYDFTDLVKSPKNLGETHIDKLKELVTQFPYFSVGNNLLVKALHNTQHYDYEKFLKQAALLAGNRSVLYNLVHDLPLETDSDIKLNQGVENLQFQGQIGDGYLNRPSELDAAIADAAKIEAANKEDTAKAAALEPNADVAKAAADVAKAAALEAAAKLEAAKFEAKLENAVERNALAFEDKNDAIPLQEISENITLPETKQAFDLPIVAELENAEPLIEMVSAPTFKEEIKPEPIELSITDRDPTVIYEDEKLVSATGKFEKFIPKTNIVSNDNEDGLTSLIQLVGDPDDDVLGNFDISSLDTFVSGNTYTVAPIEPIEEPLEIIQAGINEHEAIVPFENSPIESTAETHRDEVELADSDFLKWISEKEEVTDESVLETSAIETSIVETSIIETATVESPIELEPAFVSTTVEESIKAEVLFVTPVIEEPTVENLIAETPIIVKPRFAPPIVETPVVETPVVETPLVELPKIEVPIASEQPIVEDTDFVFNFKDAISVQANNKLSETILNSEKEAPKLKIAAAKEIATTQNMDALQSLREYDVNEFLAPLYKQVSYNPEQFNHAFAATYGGMASPEFTFDSAFVSLTPIKELEKEATKEILRSTPRFEPKVEINIPRTAPYRLEDAVKETIVEKIVPEIVVPKTSLKEPHIESKIAGLPAPKIARDPGTVESILDKFIRENPSIARPKSEFYSPVNMAKQSAEESAEIVSETLAQIYTKQGLHKKAITMYEKLGLHYPDKFSYFAALISQIKSAHNIE